MANYLTITFN